MSEDIKILPELFLRAPFYSFKKYDLKLLPQVLLEQYFQNAIWLASPVFYNVIKSKQFNFLLLNEKEKFTLAKYFNRMCYRPTPFGSFATFTDLTWSDEGPVTLSNDDRTILHLFPDRESSAVRFKAQRPFIAETLLIKNPTLYRLSDYFRYLHTSPGNKGRYRFRIDGIDAVKFNRELLSLIKDEPVPAQILEDWIIENAGCTQAAANDYLRFLIEDQVLYTQDQGAVICTGEVSSNELTDLWRSWRKDEMSNVGSLIERVPEMTPLFAETNGQPTKAYYYAAAERQYVAGGLPSEDKQELVKALRVLDQLALKTQLDALSNFTNDFKARFDLQKVPLLLAIDPDTGVYYGDRIAQAAGHQLLEDIRFPVAEKQSPVKWEPTRDFFLKLWLSDHHRAWNDPIIIKDADLKNFKFSSQQLSPSAAIMFRKTDDLLVVDNAGGSSATQLLGRFSLFSEKTDATCRYIAELEQQANPDVVFADIEQISDSYMDNINQRRQIYQYVIPLNVYSQVSADRQLLPEDLVLSVRSDELILESKRLAKRVIPRIASAYNYRHNETPLFRLLGDLQFQNLKSNLGLDLTLLFPGLGYYPRVIYGRTILFPATWFLDREQVQNLELYLKGEIKKSESVTSLQLPRYFCVGQHDQQLVINLLDQGDQQLLLQWLKDRQEVVIREYLLSDTSTQAIEQPLAAQYVGVLSRSKPVYDGLKKDTHPSKSKVRKFMPGSDWLYLKLYCTPASANVLLQQVIFPVTAKHRHRLRTWFFIRYADPGNHLRIRIRVKGADTGQLLAAIKVQLQKTRLQHLVSSFVCDTYHREIERYGADHIDQAEAVFAAGSFLCSEFICSGKMENKDHAEFKFALWTAYQMIHIFYPERPQAINFTREITDSYLEEFRADKNFKIDLDTKYRSLKADIHQCLSIDNELFIGELQEQLSGLLNEIKKLSEMMRARDPTVKSRMMADLVHMQMNRTFMQRQRQQELLVYYCLHKYLVSLEARSKSVVQAG